MNCPSCDKELKTAFEINQHLRSEKFRECKEYVIKNPPKGWFECKLCKKFYPSRQSYNNHVKSSPYFHKRM